MSRETEVYVVKSTSTMELPLRCMSDCERHSVIRFLTVKNTSTAEIHWQLTSVYGEETMSVQHVQKWVCDFSNGCFPSWQCPAPSHLLLGCWTTMAGIFSNIHHIPPTSSCLIFDLFRSWKTNSVGCGFSPTMKWKVGVAASFGNWTLSIMRAV